MTDPKKLFTKVKELGHVNSKRNELQELCSSRMDQICKFLPRRILDGDGGDLFNCLLNGLPDNPETSSKQAAKFIDIVLGSMRKESTSITHCSDVVSRLCLELSQQKPDDLVRWSNDSVQSIIQDTDVNMIWRDVLPECINALMAHNEIKHCGTTMSSEEYKQQCVRTLCQCNWNEKQLVQLAAMFRDMHLPKNDHKQVVNKICTYIIDIPPNVLPPLVHQLLKLCKLHHIEIVLAHLSHYFSVRLYCKLEPPPQDSESTTMDIDDIVPHSTEELSSCLSTCIYHIAQGVAEPEVIRKHLKAWPRTQLLRNPFLVDIALAISDKGADFRSACLDVIRLAIEQRVVDEKKRLESAWVRSVLPPDVDVASMLKVLTTESANHRQLTVVGLINLALALLGMQRVKPAATACWSYGKLILARLCKAQPETAPTTLRHLADRLAGDAARRQCADCLYILCKLTPVSVERCSELSTIMENCQPVAGDFSVPAAVLDAVHPLLNFSTRTRDTLVMVCRKGLYSREWSHRCLSVSGLLSVLRHVRLPRGSCSSQGGGSEPYSAHSYLTQLTIDLHATQQGATVASRVRNEAVCMEVVSILRRCLVQDSAVKQLLYSQLYDCVREKPALHEPILELIYEHLIKYLPESDTDETPLFLDKCIQVNATNAVLIEPIGYLLYATAQFLQLVEDDDLEDILSSQCADTGCAHLKAKLSSIMDKLCKSNIGRIDLDDTGLTDLTAESKAKCHKVQQALQCLEALVAHGVMQWSSNSTGVADTVYDLFCARNRLVEQTKTPSKTGKKGNKSLNETKETNKSQKSQKSQKGKGPIKISNLTKDRAGPFKPLPCLWDLRFCLRLLELLYSEKVQWCSMEERNKVRGRKDFHQWTLKGVLSSLGSERVDKRAVVCYVPKMAAVLYARCLCRFQYMCDFDDQTLVGCIDVFKACLSLLLSAQYSLKVDNFIPTIIGVPDATASLGLGTILETLHAALIQVEEESNTEERDLVLKKLFAALAQTVALLLEIPVLDCSKMSEVLVMLEEYIRKSKQEWFGILPALLTATARGQQECPLIDDLLNKLVVALGFIDEEDTSTVDDTSLFPAIDAKTGHVVLNHVCNHIVQRTAAAEHLLHRAKDLTLAQNTAVHGHQQRIDREENEVYKSVVIQLCQVGAWCGRAARLRCCVGAGSERVLAALQRLYGALRALGTALPPAAASRHRLDRLAKLCGKRLSVSVDALIAYIEAGQSNCSPAAILRHTRPIPRLVLAAEEFTRCFVVLAQAANLNIQHYFSLGTARDFRIRAPVLQEALQAAENEASPHQDDEDNNINDAATEILSLVGSDQEDGSDEDNSRKRRRVS
ncbi:hypothetical protein ACJJTC_003856 [Scirpophaga incertulas]